MYHVLICWRQSRDRLGLAGCFVCAPVPSLMLAAVVEHDLTPGALAGSRERARRTRVAAVMQSTITQQGDDMYVALLLSEPQGSRH